MFLYSVSAESSIVVWPAWKLFSVLVFDFGVWLFEESYMCRGRRGTAD